MSCPYGNCYLDSGVNPIHFGTTCFKCGSTNICYAARTCDCFGQCGCPIGAVCLDCKTPLMSKKGHGACSNIRFWNNYLKNRVSGQRCILKGCQKQQNKRADGKWDDYCGRTHAREDGAC